MVTDPKQLRDAEVATLVIESGRHLEALAKGLITAKTGPDGKPLMLGERMRDLKERLDKPTWLAYRAWSKERNAYVHAEQTDLTDRERFYENYTLVAAALGKLQKPRRKRKSARKPRGKTKASSGGGRYVLLATAIVAAIALYYAGC